MPKPANPDCAFCDGTGIVTAEAAAKYHSFVAGKQCVCTVTDDEVFGELQGMFDDIIKRSENR